jgi:hypothetical protein
MSDEGLITVPSKVSAHSCTPEFDTNEQESLQSKSSRCVFVRIEWVARSPIWLRISGSAMAMYLLI